MAPIDTCALCFRERPLCESHIIPDWMYEKTRDENRAFISASAHPRHRPKPIQKGYWEHLLCEDCEGQFSAWEGRGKLDIYRILEAAPKRGGLVTVPGVDQSNLILLGWSILWRASVCSRITASEVSVGPLEVAVRGALFEGKAANLSDFPILLVRLDGSEAAQRSILPPHAWKAVDVPGFRMLAFGIMWFWATSSRRARWITETHGVRWLSVEEDELTIPARETTDATFLRDMRMIAERRGMLD